jgi:hypothetical protein
MAAFTGIPGTGALTGETGRGEGATATGLSFTIGRAAATPCAAKSCESLSSPGSTAVEVIPLFASPLSQMIHLTSLPTAIFGLEHLLHVPIAE